MKRRTFLKRVQPINTSLHPQSSRAPFHPLLSEKNRDYLENQTKNKRHFSLLAPFTFIFRTLSSILKGLHTLFSIPGLRLIKNTLWQFISFTLLLILYLFNVGVISWLTSLKIFPRRAAEKIQRLWSPFYIRSTKLFQTETNSISRIDLIELSIRNMRTKQVRSMVTIGGMAIGIGTIVFLISIGYGLEQLVISRVARLDEMKQADISPQVGGKVKINDKTISDLKGIPTVEAALPMIAVVGKISYKSSVSTMAVYGVTADYLKQSAIQPVQGKIFDSNDLSYAMPPSSGEVAGVSTIASDEVAMGGTIQSVDFTINPSSWVRVRENSSVSAKILGYSKRVEGQSQGEEVWGEKYIDDNKTGVSGHTADGKTLGKWIKAPALLWKQEKCDPKTQGDCEDGKYLILRDADNKQVQKEGYFAEVNVTIKGGGDIAKTQILGVSTTSQATISGSLNWVDIASEAGIIAPPETKTVSLAPTAKLQAVVNRAMLKVLGLTETASIGEKFSASFVVVGDLLPDQKEKIESIPVEYTIVGVVPDEKTPFFYVPFMDLRSLGITNYSQVKLVVTDSNNLSKIRRQVEAMGYATHSVTDTVAQINSLFATARTIMALFGIIALIVAALGMFNTLTVSLLERTREVGLMKAMGMKSSEVRELFLTESMIMGFFGGVLGIIAGFIGGKLLGIMLSFVSIFKGMGFVDVSYIPLPFVIIVIVLSLLVGITTGIYPAKRATKISALDALRYE